MEFRQSYSFFFLNFAAMNQNIFNILHLLRKRFLQASIVGVLICMLPQKGYGQEIPTTLDQLREKFERQTNDELDQAVYALLSAEQYEQALVAATILTSRFVGKTPSETDQQMLGRIYNNLGLIYFYFSDYTRAYNNFMQAIDYTEECELAPAYNNIASLYYYFADYDNASRYLRQSYENAAKFGRTDYMAGPLQNLLDIGFVTDSIEKILPYVHNYIEVAAADSSSDARYTVATCKGMQAFLKGSYTEAISQFALGIRVANNPWNANRLRIANETYIAKALWSLGRREEALDSLKAALSIAQKQNYIEMEMDAWRSLAQYVTMMGRHEEASNYRLRYMELKDSIFNTKEFGKIKDQQFFGEIDHYSKEVERLWRLSRLRQWLAIGALLLMVVSAIVSVYVVRKNHQLREYAQSLFQHILKQQEATNHEQQLQQQIKELREYSQSLLQHIQEQQEATNHEQQLQQQINEMKKEHQGPSLDSDRQEALLLRISEVMNTPEHFCTPDFTIDTLAQLVGSNTKYVSHIINSRIGKSFPMLLAEARVGEAYKRLADTDRYGNLTQEAIAEGLGFRSRSNFSVLFKKISGLTPTQYMALAREKEALP